MIHLRLNIRKPELKKTILIFFGIVFFLYTPFIQASRSQYAEQNPGDRSLTNSPSFAVSLGKESIAVDGKLNETSWKRAPAITNFIQQNPDEGQPSTEITEVRILYSKGSLYVGVRAFDSESKKIKGILARRDSECPSDWIKIYIDSYHDRLTAFEFSVNSSGVKRDTHWSNDSRSDKDWDAVWDVEVSKDKEGWTAEFRIPFSQIRFPEKPTHTWGFQVCREIARKKEISYWQHVPKGIPRFVSLFGYLTGIQGIPSPKRLQLLPYTVSQANFQPAEEGNPFLTGSSYNFGLGLDIKYGVSSNLTLDATFNPDFGQVEADPAQANLTEFETYLPENRPFFIEGKNMFNFPIDVGRSGKQSLFYSRRIGRPPQGKPSSAEYSETPENTTILGALKLTGKTAQGWNIGVMEVLTGRERANIITEEDERTKETVEPLANYFLGRAEKEFRNGRSAVGLIFTAVNRKIEDESLEFLCKAAYSGGFDFRHRWAEDKYEISGFLIGSYIRGSEEALLRVQKSGVHLFQRPDATYIEVDPTRTSLSGFVSSFLLSKIGGGHWRWSVSSQIRSPEFEANDMGYLMWADEITQKIQLSYKEYKPGIILREYDITFNLTDSWTYSPSHLYTTGNLNFNLKFLNYWDLNISISRNQRYFYMGYLRGGPGLITPGSWRFGGSLSTDRRKSIHLRLTGNFTQSDDRVSSYNVSSAFTLRPSDNLNISLAPSFNDSCNLIQYVTTKTTDIKPHYILGRLDRKTVSLTFRVDYTLAPNLSLQFYSQPYISAGDYSEFKEVIQPRAENYEDRWHIFNEHEIFLQGAYYYATSPGAEGEEIIFGNPDFNFKQFRLNFVLRWEYLPGSILFLVWSNGINDHAKYGYLSLDQDLQNLFNSPSNNAFLLKLSYWFNL